MQAGLTERPRRAAGTAGNRRALASILATVTVVFVATALGHGEEPPERLKELRIRANVGDVFDFRRTFTVRTTAGEISREESTITEYSVTVTEVEPRGRLKAKLKFSALKGRHKLESGVVLEFDGGSRVDATVSRSEQFLIALKTARIGREVDVTIDSSGRAVAVSGMYEVLAEAASSWPAFAKAVDLRKRFDDAACLAEVEPLLVALPHGDRSVGEVWERKEIERISKNVSAEFTGTSKLAAIHEDAATVVGELRVANASTVPGGESVSEGVFHDCAVYSKSDGLVRKYTREVTLSFGGAASVRRSSECMIERTGKKLGTDARVPKSEGDDGAGHRGK